MEELVKDMDLFWSEAMQTFKEVVEKGFSVVNELICEPGLEQPGEQYSQDVENHDPCK